MIKRPFWLKKVEEAWNTRSIIWLSGVRRVGKTSIAKMFPDALYLNCDLPSTARQLSDPEFFFKTNKKATIIIFDEIHRLDDPSNILKIAADEFPKLRILATGSSTLHATKKFRDSLTGRKNTIYLCPVLWDECIQDFNVQSLDKRLLHGGLPELLITTKQDFSFFSEWIDSFYARDIAELFGVRDRSGFLNLLKLIFYQSGGLTDISKLASETGLSRHTVKAHIEAMSIAHAIFSVTPFHGGGRREIVRRPKIYAFDTGIIAYIRGWESLRSEERGILWEHLVLDTIRAAIPAKTVNYWRDKSDREIDFVIRQNRNRVDTIECKIDPDRFDEKNLLAFRTIYPEGINWLISPKVEKMYAKKYEDMEVRFISTQHILDGCLL
jgi:predicted AAA+ superfamily ATPase